MEIFSKKKKEVVLDTDGKPIKPKKTSEFNKAIIFYTLINLVLLGLFVFVSIRYTKLIKEEVKVVTDKRKSQSDVNLLTEYISGLEKDFNKVEGEFELYLDLLPAKDDLFDFKTDIVSTAKKYKLDPAFSFGVENPATATEPKSYGFTLIISGTTANLLNFWTDFAKMQNILRIEQILIDQEDLKTKAFNESLGSATTTTIRQGATNTGPLSLDEELELLAKNKSTTTKTKTTKKSTTTTKLINTYKMNVLGKIYIR